MPKRVWSMRLADETRVELRWLHEAWKVPYSECVDVAVHEVYVKARRTHDEGVAGERDGRVPA